MSKRKDRRVKLIAVVSIVAVLAVLVILATKKDRPGNPAVYDRIDKATSCSQLQVEFDTAEANHARDIARGRIDLAEISTSYMEAADARMRDLGCYR